MLSRQNTMQALIPYNKIYKTNNTSLIIIMETRLLVGLPFWPCPNDPTWTFYYCFSWFESSGFSVPKDA